MRKEYPCIYHKNGECMKFSGSGVKSYCVLGPCPDETPSNADRIRAMSDEELAVFINKIVVCHTLKRVGHCNYCPIRQGKSCDTEGILDYLRQPAEGGEQDEAD